jgi:hypothetical protein
MGNDQSIRESFALASSFAPHEWVYFCEDDYLHCGPEAFTWINDLIVNRETIMRTQRSKRVRKLSGDKLCDLPLIIFPADYPDRYKPGRRYKSYLFLSDHCHWRQIKNITFTYLASAATIHKFRAIHENSSHGANDNALSRALLREFRITPRCLAVSPIPGIATHMHECVMSPLTDWKTVVDKYRQYKSDGQEA